MVLKHDIKNKYFNWLYDYVCHEITNEYISYRKLFIELYNTEFTYSIQRDVNRAMDGVDLRERFALSKGDRHIADMLYGPCSILEMMIALAIRCEETIMDNPKYGDRTAQWFWGMITSLGLGTMNDSNYDENYVKDVIRTFLARQYRPDGKGGLFYIRNCPDDLRDVEIWGQLNLYLTKFV